MAISVSNINTHIYIERERSTFVSQAAWQNLLAHIGFWISKLK